MTLSQNFNRLDYECNAALCFLFSDSTFKFISLKKKYVFWCIVNNPVKAHLIHFHNPRNVSIHKGVFIKKALFNDNRI